MRGGVGAGLAWGNSFTRELPDKQVNVFCERESFAADIGFNIAGFPRMRIRKRGSGIKKKIEAID